MKKEKELQEKFYKLTLELKEMQDWDSLGYKIIWDERAEISRKLSELKDRNENVHPIFRKFLNKISNK